MATVKCKYCGQKFDRTTTAYVIPSARRYGHAECYLRQKEINPKIPELTIYDPSNFVKCKFCNKEINKLEDEYVQLSNGKYAHKKCAEIEEKREKTDYEKLEAYILELFNLEYINPRIKKQIKQYTEEYNFSYSGIQRTLEYFYKVKQNSIEKSKGGIGIVPYVYKDAYNYYYSLWEAQQKNKDISVKSFIPKVKEITISSPTCRISKRSLFSFLDEEGD